MTPIEKLKKLLLEEFVNENGDIVVTGLDLSDFPGGVLLNNWVVGDVITMSRLKAREIYQVGQCANDIVQTGQKARKIVQVGQQAMVIDQRGQEARKIYQKINLDDNCDFNHHEYDYYDYDYDDFYDFNDFDD